MFKLLGLGGATLGLFWAALLGLLALDPGVPILCSVEWPRKHICRAVGLGDVMTSAEEARLANARAQGCPAVGALIRAEPADTALSKAARQIWDTRFRQVSRQKVDMVSMELAVSVDGQSSRTGAERRIAEAARGDAVARCGLLIRDSRQKLLAAAATMEPSQCESFSSGWSCSADGQAQCRIARRSIVPEEHC